MKEEKRLKVPKSLSLNPENYEIVRRYLEAQGLTISGWLDGLLAEVAAQVQGQPGTWDKPVSKMTLEEFSAAMTYWVKAIKDEEESE